MKRVYKMMLVAASVSVLFACGSGGSGSGATGPSAGGSTGGGTSGGTTTPTTPTNSVFQGVKSLDGAAAGTATYDAANAKYVYNFNGSQIDVTSRGITAGTVVDMTVGGNKQMIGGTSYAYSRFGAIGPVGNLDASDVFYVGQKTVNMPTSGAAVYKGLVIGMKDGDGVAFDYAPVSFDVNFGAKTISGKVEDDSAIRFEQAPISGNSFAGKLLDDDKGGSYSGAFFGPAAQELGGIGKFNLDADGESGAFSFGAKKQ
ncbi:MAG: hypothetical protein H6R05_469 [Burkholderiaceae bacterium]|nr:hypothetical protein [Burkholderiaceae bacterium]